MKHAIWIFIALYTATMVVACGKNGSDASVSPATNVGCPSGTVFNNGMCVNQWGQAVGTGYNSTAFIATNYGRGGSVSIANSNTFTSFLRDAMAICDRGTYNYGTASCADYRSGYIQLTLQSVNPESHTARLTIEVQPRSISSYSYYYGSLPSGSQALTCGITMLLFGGCVMAPTAQQMQIARNPMALDLVVSAINNSQGFEGRGYGAAGTISQTSLVQLQVSNGKLSDGYFDYKIAFQGQNGGYMLTGRMDNCSSNQLGYGASCGSYYSPY